MNQRDWVSLGTFLLCFCAMSVPIIAATIFGLYSVVQRRKDKYEVSGKTPTPPGAVVSKPSNLSISAKITRVIGRIVVGYGVAAVAIDHNGYTHHIVFPKNFDDTLIVNGASFNAVVNLDGVFATTFPKLIEVGSNEESYSRKMFFPVVGAVFD